VPIPSDALAALAEAKFTLFQFECEPANRPSRGAAGGPKNLFEYPISRLRRTIRVTHTCG
jgi:hypothetical protein